MPTLHTRLARAKKLVREPVEKRKTVRPPKPASLPMHLDNLAGTTLPGRGRHGGLPLQVHLDNPSGTTPDDAAALVALILDCPRPTAERILSRTGGIAVIGRFGAQALAARAGITLPEAQRLLAALQLGHRALVVQTSPRVAFPSPESVARWLCPRMAGLPHEELWTLALDTGHRLLGACRVSQGTSSYTAFVIPVILRRALEMGASHILLAHNHPGGDATASEEDIAMTAHLFNAACAIRLMLSDHIIIGGRCFSSMRTEHVLPERPMPAIEALCPQGDYSEPVDWITLME
jgi:DNA repair protein RadC